MGTDNAGPNTAYSAVPTASLQCTCKVSYMLCALSCAQGACEGCLPLLLEKLGDNNARIRDASKESIMFIAGLQVANPLLGGCFYLQCAPVTHACWGACRYERQLLSCLNQAEHVPCRMTSCQMWPCTDA